MSRTAMRGGAIEGGGFEQRLRALEDRAAILDLEAAYAISWDTNQPQRWAELFTEGGIFEMLAAGDMPHLRFAGHEALAGFCREINMRWSGLHYLHPPQLEISGDQAQSTVFFEYKYLNRESPAHTRQGSASGHYRVTYQRTGAGWRISQRIETSVMSQSASFYDIGA